MSKNNNQESSHQPKSLNKILIVLLVTLTFLCIAMTGSLFLLVNTPSTEPQEEVPMGAQAKARDAVPKKTKKILAMGMMSPMDR